MVRLTCHLNMTIVVYLNAKQTNKQAKLNRFVKVVQKFPSEMQENIVITCFLN